MCFYFLLLQLYFIDYSITVVSISPPLPLSTQQPLLSQAIPPTIVHVHESWVWVLWLLYFLYYILHPYSYCVTTHSVLCALYILIPSPLHSFPYTPLLSGNHQNAFCTHNSVSVLLVCLVCFLDSIVHRYVFLANLLFIVLIFFFLNKSL